MYAMARSASSRDVALTSPDGTSRAYVVTGEALIAYDRDSNTTARDSTWLDSVFATYGVTALPAPEYETEGDLAGWRCWTIILTSRS